MKLDNELLGSIEEIIDMLRAVQENIRNDANQDNVQKLISVAMLSEKLIGIEIERRMIV